MVYFGFRFCLFLVFYWICDIGIFVVDDVGVLDEVYFWIVLDGNFFYFFGVLIVYLWWNFFCDDVVVCLLEIGGCYVDEVFC